MISLFFSIHFDVYLANLSTVLKRCEEVNIILKLGKHSFHSTKGIVSGYKVVKKQIDVDKTKMDMISNIPVPISMK